MKKSLFESLMEADKRSRKIEQITDIASVLPYDDGLQNEFSAMLKQLREDTK